MENKGNFLFIDCEFNGFDGDLISMAIVDCHGKEFYEVMSLPRSVRIDPWVAENVVPVLNKRPIIPELLQSQIFSFLSDYENFTIIADWPLDLVYFCKSLIRANGASMIPIPRFGMRLERSLGNDYSVIPHNALSDARAIRDKFLWEGLNERA